jgi:hypothetical protein
VVYFHLVSVSQVTWYVNVRETVGKTDDTRGNGWYLLKYGDHLLIHRQRGMVLLLSIPYESRVSGPTNVPPKADATIEASPVNMTLFYFRQLADKQTSARLVHICINLLTTTFAIKNLCIQTTVSSYCSQNTYTVFTYTALQRNMGGADHNYTLQWFNIYYATCFGFKYKPSSGILKICI